MLAALAAASIADGAVKATVDARELTKATWLVQKLMTEVETKMETDGIEKACEKKMEGKFEAPYEKYTWISYCTEIDLKLSQSAAKMAAASGSEEGSNEPTKEDMFQKTILTTAGDYLTKALRELHVEVYWLQGKTKRKVTLSTHFVRFDLPLTLGGFGVPGAGQ